MPTPRDRILTFLVERPSATGRQLREHLGVSRQALSAQLRPLVAAGKVVRSGTSRGASYSLPRAGHRITLRRVLKLTGLHEAATYEMFATSLNLAVELADHVEAIVRYAFTEMLNHAIDHSGAFFMDGVIESGTAFLLEDYADTPGQHGHPFFSLEQFIELGSLCDRLGLQIRVHAIGDAAIRHTLDGYEAIQRMNGHRDSRHRIEHIELLHPADTPRFHRLGVIASMQPLHLAGSNFENDVWLKRTGDRRWEYGFPWRSLRKMGTHLVFGSDWPVVSPNPMLGLDRAVNRTPWLPCLTPQTQTLAETLASYTRQAAYAEFQEYHKGQLQPGGLALLLLDLG